MLFISPIVAAIQRRLILYREARLHRYLQSVKAICLKGVELNVTGISLSMKLSLISGQFEKAEVEMADSIIQCGDRILDLGAGLGFVGIHAIKNLGAQSIVAVEANPGTYELLKDNYSRNKVSGECLHAAASNNDGFQSLIVTEDFWTDRLENSDNTKDVVKREVPALSFDTLFKMCGERTEVLMIDIEGAEFHAVQSPIPKGIRAVIIEIHPDILSKNDVGSVTHWLVSQDFRLINSSGRVLGFERKR